MVLDSQKYMYISIHAVTNRESASCTAHQENQVCSMTHLSLCSTLMVKISLCPLVTFHFTAIYHLLYVWQPASPILDPNHIAENPHGDLCWTKYHLRRFSWSFSAQEPDGFHSVLSTLLCSGLCHDIDWPFGFSKTFLCTCGFLII